MRRLGAVLVSLALLLASLPTAGAAFESYYGGQFAAGSLAQRVYQALSAEMAPGVEEITVSTEGLVFEDLSEELFAACAAYQYDYPESQYAAVTGAKPGPGELTLFITQSENGQARKQALDEAVAEFAADFEARAGSLGRVEQYRFIHDEICARARYADGEVGTSGAAWDPAHTVYGVLVDEVAVVCEGYAETFQVLCSAVGLPCILVVGEGRQGETFADPMDVNHMWNAVCVDGDWYGVDVTWDDAEEVRDTYFLNNAFFLEGTAQQDHRATGELVEGVRKFGLPELAIVEGGSGFSDVMESDWYYDAVCQAVEQGLFSGVSADRFAPGQNMSRAMMVTVLAAMEFGGGQVPEGTSDFEDLRQDWYQTSVAWAAESGITAGVSETEFAPDKPVTREQAAVFLYAYAKWKGYDVSVGENTNILSYNDAEAIHEFAIPAMQWACGAGLIDGTPEGDLLPLAEADRAQMAAILIRFGQAYSD